MKAANTIYKAMISTIQVLDARRVPWAIQSPWRSLLWWIPEVHALLDSGAVDIDYHACMHGGSRKKGQRVRTTFEMSHLAVVCDGQHEHRPWKLGRQLLTAEEAEYPSLFCERVASAIANDKQVQTLIKLSQLKNQLAGKTSIIPGRKREGMLLDAALCAAQRPQPAEGKHAAKAGVDTQPRQGVGWTLISEFKATYTIQQTTRDDPATRIYKNNKINT